MNKKCPEGLPKLPGVYLFKDAQDTIIYIGKAKSLHDRVKSYFINDRLDGKITSLIQEFASIAHVVTVSEHEALVLEASLIKQYQPKYNSLLKDGQPFVYLLYTQKPFPAFTVVRNKKAKGVYFGPFVHKVSARRAVQFLTHTFRLFICNKKIPNGCLYFHINKCAGSCRTDFDIAAYCTRAQLALYALHNDRDAFKDMIKKEIALCNAQLKFERARHMLHYLESIDSIFNTLNYHISNATYAAAVAHALVPRRTYAPKIDDPEQLALELQHLTHAQNPIRTIDCFDISHFQSKNLVGSCIRFVDGRPEKNKFRRFKIRTLETQNDYAALQEIVSRRYRNEEDMPDLILIDGGIGQLNAIRFIMPHAFLASLAKREERLYTTNNAEGIVLDNHNKAAQTLIALRDYSHHFAITYQRLKQQRF